MAAVIRWLALAIFAAILLGGSLLFGTADRVVQVGLLVALGVGFLLVPPVVPRLRRAVKWSIAGLFMLVFGKEFLPAVWFGETVWHHAMASGFGLNFPLTHNPEPGRAIDAILAAAVAGGWFVWVRTLAAERRDRMVLAWCMFGAAAVFAVTCLLLGTRGDSLIWGIRYTPGWTGFGLFPNRNHTAAFLAMGALVGCGCTVRAGRRKNWGLLVAGGLGIVLIFVALLESRSRGGLLGFGCGLGVLGALALAKLRSRASMAGVLAGVCLTVGLLFAFGGGTLARFGSQTEENVTQNIRWSIWRDAVSMWKDAPLFGHGLDTFASLFPFYQTALIEDATVLHPESSWRLWLAEMGVLAVVLGAVSLLFFIWRNWRDSWNGERGFFLRAGALAAVAALLCHAIWDVPAHRWGTAGFAIAALAIACPMRSRDARVKLGFAPALVPLGAAAVWAIPFWNHGPAWSPENLRLTLERNAVAPSRVSDAELQDCADWFPLNARLHQALGVRALLTHNQPPLAWKEFRIADRLAPDVFDYAASQAWISRRFSSGMALHYWTTAIEHAGRHEEEMFRAAYEHTAGLAGAGAFWEGYLAGHPEFLLSYAGILTNREKKAEAGKMFARWWQARALGAQPLKQFEREQYFFLAQKWSNPDQLALWRQKHPDWEAHDFLQWAELLHGWKRDDLAWLLLARWIPEPLYPPAATLPLRALLEARWSANPSDAVAAQALAAGCFRDGDVSRAEKIVLGIADGKNPPVWFVQKAAYLRAAKGDYAAAVAALLGAGRGG